MSHVCPILLFYPVPVVLKYTPLLINVCLFCILYINGLLPTSTNQLVNYYFSTMMYLSNVLLTLRSNAYYRVSFIMVKSTELGLLNFSVNTYVKTSFSVLSGYILNLSIHHPMLMVMFSSFMIVFFAVFL